MRFSDYFSEYRTYTISEKLMDFLGDIKASEYASGIDTLKIGDHIFINFEISVDLPSRGTHNGIDVRKKEPVMIIVNESRYPYEAPIVVPDRTDFPVDILPHLNNLITGCREFKSLCLVREDTDEWFSRITPVLFLQRIREWFADAAAGQLMPHWDYYEPFRAEAYSDFFLYDMSIVDEFVLNEMRRSSKKNYGFFLTYKNTIDGQNIFSIEGRPYLKHKSNSLISDTKKMGEKAQFGIIIWPEADSIGQDFFSADGHEIIAKYQEQVHFKQADCYEMIGNALNRIEGKGFSKQEKTKLNIPLILILPRPRNVIGNESQFEHICGIFSIESGVFVPSRHITPLMPTGAKRLSGHSIGDDLKIAFAGCGALGSKVGYSLLRNGIDNIIWIDKDMFFPHNAVRHSFPTTCTLEHKSKLMQEASKTFGLTNHHYLANKFQNIFPSPTMEEHLTETGIILDFSASENLFGYLCDKSNQYKQRIVRGEMAYSGRLGLLFCESKDRSVCLLDLRASMLDMSLDDAIISKWLETQYHGADSSFQIVNIGQNCSSNTMILPDEIVSYHASIMTSHVKRILADNRPESGVLISYYEPDVPEASYTRFLQVDSYQSVQIGDWTVKLSQNFIKTSRAMVVDAGCLETGGTLIGMINERLKIVYVTRTLSDPNAIKRKESFVIGGVDHREEFDEVIRKSGRQLQLVGQWHSHPNGSVLPSHTDLTTMSAIREEMPHGHVLLSIITNGDQFNLRMY